MSRNRFLVLCLLPLLLLLMALRDAPLVDPDPIAIPAGVKTEAVGRAVRQALNTRGWSVTEENPARSSRPCTCATTPRASWGQLGCAPAASSTWTRRTSSTTWKTARPYIHKNYLGWVQNLSHDISGALNLLADSK